LRSGSRRRDGLSKRQAVYRQRERVVVALAETPRALAFAVASPGSDVSIYSA